MNQPTRPDPLDRPTRPDALDQPIRPDPLNQPTRPDALDRPDQLGRPLWALTDSELTDQLDGVFTGLQTLRAQWLELIAELDRRNLPTTLGATGTSAWLRDRMRIHPRTATRDLTLARTLRRLPATTTALADGALNTEQAQVIAHTMTDLPTSLGQAIHTQAEDTLITYAAQFGPPQLARLGDRILELVAPQIAEDHLGAQLAREEARAHRERHLTLSPLGIGRTRLTGILTNADAATITAAIDSLCSPAACRTQPPTAAHHNTHHTGHTHDPSDPGDTRKPCDTADPADTRNLADPGSVGAPGDSGNLADPGSVGDPGEQWTPGRRRIDALVQLCQMVMASGKLPAHGGGRPQVIVTMPFQPWQQATHTALIQTAPEPDEAARITTAQTAPGPTSPAHARIGQASIGGTAFAQAGIGQASNDQNGIRQTSNGRNGIRPTRIEPTRIEPTTTVLNSNGQSSNGQGSIAQGSVAQDSNGRSSDGKGGIGQGSVGFGRMAMARIGIGQLADGRLVSAATVRRMACDAGILPMILGSHGQVLDVGQQQRLFTGPIRKALHVRDRGCAYPTCSAPPTWCDGHHIRPWMQGGSTSLDNAVLLCRRHHVLIHDGDWTVRIAADRLPEFVPPTYIDPLQRPRRNRYHRRT